MSVKPVIIQRREFTSSSLPYTKLNPDFVSGFVDGEGSFYIGMSADKKRTVGWCIIPGFSIALHAKDLVLLKQIQSFFGVGGISLDNKRNAAYYRVSGIEDLSNCIIPHFEKHPLLTQKKADFLLFKSVIELMSKKEHISDLGLRKLLTFKASMNKGLNEKLKESFPEIVQVERPKVEIPSAIDANWLAGFSSGEGSFIVSVYKSSKSKLGRSVQLKFQVSQHERDEELLALIVKYLNCGSLQVSRKARDLQVTRFNDIYDIIIPFFF